MRVQAIIVAAGSGLRLKSEVPKPLVKINDKPILAYTLDIFEKSPVIDSIILVVPHSYKNMFSCLCEDYQISKVTKVVSGGDTRSLSVENGLKVLDESTEIVVIHDGARPLITEEIIEQSIKLCEIHEAVVVAVPVKPTIKRINLKEMVVEETLDRKALWEIQTPQVFKKAVILEAHQKALDQEATDDAFLVEKMGKLVKVLEGDYKNIKITTPEDLVLAEKLLCLSE